MNDDSNKPSARPRGRDVLYVTILTAGISVVGIAALLGAAGHLSSAPSGLLSLPVVLGSILILNGAVIASVAAILLRMRRMTWRDLGFCIPRNSWLWGAPSLGIVTVVAIEGIGRALNVSASELTTKLIAPQGFSWTGLLGALVFIGFFAPFGEELYFRGLIYRWLRNRWNPFIAAPVSALLFAGAHFYYSLPVMLIVALLGLLLAVAFELSGSIWTPVAIHAVQNSIVVSFVYWSLT